MNETLPDSLTGAPPRILYVLSCWPHDRAYGGQIRALHVARALSAVGRITLAVVGADEVPQSVKAEASREFDVAGEWAIEPTGIHGAEALWRSLTDPDFVNIHGMALRTNSEREIRAIAEHEVDLVWFFQLRTANYFRKARWPGAVVDVDNFPSAMATTDGIATPGLKASLSRQVRGWQTRRHERTIPDRFGVVSVCSEADRLVLGGDDRIHVIPNGFEPPRSAPARIPTDPPRIGFIGLLEYGPNREGLRWFMAQCWPSLRAAVPGLRLRVAGKGGETVTTEPIDGVDMLGWIDDAGAEMATWSLTVVPIFSGAGTRIKVADAFSRRCPVVSTSRGVYGYEVADRRELRIGDTPGTFAEACLDLIRDASGAAQMAERAWQAYLRNWTWDAIAPKVRAAADEALRLKLARLPSETRRSVGSERAM